MKTIKIFEDFDGALLWELASDFIPGVGEIIEIRDEGESVIFSRRIRSIKHVCYALTSYWEVHISVYKD